jgi:hypothetical protein
MEQGPRAGIHRRSEVTRLAALLERAASAESGLLIGAVSGPGGVGKSYLVDHVLAAAELPRLGYVRLSVDGSSPQLRGDFFGVIEQLARRSLPPPAKLGRDYFPEVRRVAGIHRELIERAAGELSAHGAPEATKLAALALLRGARFLNEHLPKTREYLDVASFGLGTATVVEGLDAAWDAMGKLDALREASGLPGPVRDLVGISRKNRVKRDLFNVTAEALISDLSAALRHWQRSDALKLTHPPIPGATRLLLIFDDYEVLAPVLGDFLVGSLVPRLAEASFPTLMLVCGRDDLEATHTGWAQHAKKHLAEQIHLAPFAREEAMALLEEGGVAEARRGPIFELTQGFPFLLTLAIEEAGFEGAGSALFLRKFFDRTTRWMTPREQEWFARVCYLDVVNEDTLRRLFPDEDVRRIQDWFEREASIRDPAAEQFRVRPLIREKVLRYLELRSPSRHQELRERAGGAAS